MARSVQFVAFALLLAAIGCGSKTSEVANVAPGENQSTSPTASPTDVVSQFLDLIRRGGEDSNAGILLTKKAQSELKRIGRTVQPIGSPDARFTVTRSEPVPDQPDAALVHSIWTEPNGEGVGTEFQVVWALQKELSGWRISGLALEITPNADPQIIDFEDGQRMAQLLDVTESEIATSNDQSGSQKR